MVSTTSFDSRIQCWANERTLDPQGLCKLEIKEHRRGMKSEHSSGKVACGSGYSRESRQVDVRMKRRLPESLSPGGLATNLCALLPVKRQVLTMVVLKEGVLA